MDTPVSPIALVQQAITGGTLGQILWNDRADECVRSNPDLQGFTPEAIRRLLHDFGSSGGRVDERRESRPNWLEAHADRPAYYRDWWYRAVIPVPGVFPKGLFVEIRLFDDDPDDPWVEIVNAHSQV